jgi:hypothetical protein
MKMANVTAVFMAPSQLPFYIAYNIPQTVMLNAADLAKSTLIDSVSIVQDMICTNGKIDAQKVIDLMENIINTFCT